MPIKVGANNPSSLQRRLLAMARNTSEAFEFYEYLMRVLRDDDITSGREQLLPGWLKLFEMYRDDLARHPMTEWAEEALGPLVSSILNEATLAGIDPKKCSIAFLLGAGASKPHPSGIPTVAELLPDLLSRGRRLDREDVNRLAEFCENSNISNIEDLLTAAQLAEYCGRRPTVLRLIEFLLYRQSDEDDEDAFFRRSRIDIGSVSFLQDTLQVLFGLLSSRMLPAEPNSVHESIAEYAKRSKEAAVITTNYDCCMDLALSAADVKFSYCLQFSNGEHKEQDDEVKLVKLHGSLNWFYCDVCQNVNLIDIKNAIRNFESDGHPYPVIGVCKGCGGQRRGLLVPPLAMKFDIAPALNGLLEKAGSDLESADVLAVVGFSFAEADQYISRLVGKWMQRSPNRKLIIFDPDRSVAIKMQKQFSVRIANFDPSRVVGIGGDSSKSVPDFLAGKMHKSPDESSGDLKAGSTLLGSRMAADSELEMKARVPKAKATRSRRSSS